MLRLRHPISLLLICALVLLGVLRSYSTPAPLDAGAPDVVFSADRAEAILREDAVAAQDALDFLSAHAETQFKTEEGLMHQHHYPFTYEHLRQHLTFTDNFKKLREAIEAGKYHPLYLAFRVQLLLIDWLINHTAQTDRHLARFLHNLGRQSASSA